MIDPHEYRTSSINERVNKELASRQYLNSPRPDYLAILADIIRKFDPPMSLEQLTNPPEIE